MKTDFKPFPPGGLKGTGDFRPTRLPFLMNAVHDFGECPRRRTGTIMNGGFEGLLYGLHLLKFMTAFLACFQMSFHLAVLLWCQGPIEIPRDEYGLGMRWVFGFHRRITESVQSVPGVGDIF